MIKELQMHVMRIWQNSLIPNLAVIKNSIQQAIHTLVNELGGSG